MAEIKTTFTKGRMNKDLDERLISKGEYRDAVNVEVSTSEGSNVGTVQNIIGNVNIEDVVPSGFKCVGSVADEANNRLYWLGSSKNKDIIFEYDVDRKEPSLVFVDIFKKESGACLKFGNKIITGINVLDNFLFFTDGESEPKKINIKRSKIGTLNVNTHTVLINSDSDNYSQNLGPVKEENITVIKKRPTTPLIYKVKKSKSNKEKGIFEKTFPRFSYRYKYADNEYSAFGPFTSPVFSADYTDDFNSATFYSKKEGYNTAMVNTIESVELSGLKTNSMPRDVVSVDILFKREDSNVVYTVETLSVDEINETENIDSSFGFYTLTTENIFAAIEENQILRPFDNVPKTALAQEVVGNRIVYANYTQGHDVGKVKVNSNYEIRNLKDKTFLNGGLESLKAQRDYQIGVVFGDEYGRETPVFTSDQGSVTVPWANNNVSSGPSYLSSLILNSSITTLAPSWANYYKFYIKETSGEYYNLLMDRVYLPSSSTDYENKEDHVYLAFDSADINKVQEDSYLVLKKTSSPNEKYISDLNRYKVLDISATAPDAIAYMYLPLGAVTNIGVDPVTGASFETNLANGSAEGSLFQNSERRIDQQTDVIEVDKSSWIDFGFPTLRGSGVVDGNSGISNDEFADLYVSWKKTEASGIVTHSRRYRVVENQVNSGTYVLKLKEKISFEDAELAKGTTTDVLNSDLEFKVFRKERRDGQNFSGKFFVKVISDDILKNNILGQETNISNSRFITASNDLFWWADPVGQDGDGDADGLNNQFFTPYGTNPSERPLDLAGIDGTTNTFAEWNILISEPTYFKKMFVDNMYMASSSLSEDGYAINTGQGVVGSGITYPKIEWDSESGSNWNIDGDSSWSVSDISAELWTDNVVNGISGVVEVDGNYIEGPGAWKKDIYSNEIDQVYGENEGGYFMHISFFAPGKDLHSGDFGGSNTLENIDVSGENSIASLLQGIWGGGAFTREDGTGFGALGATVEFEGNYLGDDALSEAPGPGIGKGYDLEYKEYHDKQWDPTFSTTKRSFGSVSESNKDLEDFVENLIIGSKFKFKDDPDAEVYTIIDVSIKHIYNHTPWRSTYINHTSDGIIRGGNSVEEAAVLWADAKQNGTDQDADANGVTPAQNLINKIEQFGQASNRRTCYILRLDKNPTSSAWHPVLGGQTDGVDNTDLDTATKIQFIDSKAQAQSDLKRDASAIFETEPKDSLDLNIFYEATQAIPTNLTLNNANDFAPPGTRVEMTALPQALRGQNIVTDNMILSSWDQTQDGKLFFNVINESSLEDYTETGEATDENGSTINFTRINWEQYNKDLAQGNANKTFNYNNSNALSINYSNVRIKFYRPNGSYTSCRLLDNDDSINSVTLDDGSLISPISHGNRFAFVVDTIIDLSLPVGIDWFNCYSFGNGVESNRIRDDFNMPFISNGARASTTIEESYPLEERRKHGLIYSGLYNGTSGLNNLNQFIQAEKITKDLNPTYGSIQKLFTRRSDLIAFCEDRVIKILANKDALFNADGNVNLVATENVLGQASPFVGDFGISQNPESFAKESYRAYFTDRSRGAVLRLSMDGITPISEAGMHDWFRDNIPLAGTLLGTYDDYKKQYNITLDTARYNNILVNSYFTDGELLNTSDATFQLISNSDLDSGDSYSIVNINTLYNDPETSPILNETFSAQTTIVNWPAIPRGQMSSYFTNTIDQYASLTYTQVVQQYGVVSYQMSAAHGSTATALPTYDYPVDTIQPAAQGTYPSYGSFGGYIARNGDSSNYPSMTQDPFSVNGEDDNHTNCQYYSYHPTKVLFYDTASDANVFAYDYGVLTQQSDQLSSNFKGILFKNTANSSAEVSMRFPNQAKDSNGNFQVNNSTGAWDAISGYVTSAQQELDSNAYVRSVFNGEVVIVKVKYRLRKDQPAASVNDAQDWGSGDGDMTVTLMNGASTISGSGIVSNIFNTDGTEWGGSNMPLITTASQIYTGAGFPSATNSDPWNYNYTDGDNQEANSYNGLYHYSSYTLQAQANSPVYDDLVQIGNISSTTCSFTWSTNSAELDPENSYYSDPSFSSWDTTRDDLWNWDSNVTYDTLAVHKPRYSKERIVLFQFRLFDKDDPWTPKKIVNHLNAKITCKVSRYNHVMITGLAMFKRRPITDIGSVYIPSETITEDQEFTSSAVYGLISSESTDIIIEDTAQSQAATQAYGTLDSDTEQGSVQDIGDIIPGQEGAAIGTVTATITTLSNEIFTPATYEDPIEQPNEDTPGFDPASGVNGEIPAWAEVVHSTPQYFTSYNDTYGSLIAQQEETYGPANQGQWQSYTYGDSLDPSTGYYRIGQGNGVTQYSDTGDALGDYDGQANIEFGPQANAKIQYINIDQGEIEVSSPGFTADSGFIYTHPDDQTLFETGKWYLVDLEYEGDIVIGTTSMPGPTINGELVYADIIQINGGYVWLNKCLDDGIASLCHGENQGTNVQDSSYPLGAFGQAYYKTGSSGLSMMPAIATEYGPGNKTVLRAVFKATESSGLFIDYNFKKVDIRCYSVDNSINFKSLTVINISDTNNSGVFSGTNWTIESNPETINALDMPEAYYFNSQWIWNTSPPAPYEIELAKNKNKIAYSFGNELYYLNNAIYEIHYSLLGVPVNNLQVSGNQFNGTYYVELVTPQQTNGKYYRLKVQGDLGSTVNPGDHKFSINFDSGQVIEEIPNGSTITYEAVDQLDPQDEENKVIITGDGDQGFSAALQYFRLYTGSTSQTGGSVDGWTFQKLQYINQQLQAPITSIVSEDYINFENEKVTFTNAPFGVMISQHIYDEILLGHNYNINFSMGSIATPVEIYYFTPNSVQGNATGFRVTPNLITNVISDLEEYSTSEFSNVNLNTALSNSIVHSVSLDVSVQDMSNSFNPETDIVGALVFKILPWNTLSNFGDSITEQTILTSGATIDTFTGTLDNIRMSQVGNDFEKPITVSYSEDVKGWVSFKTFYNNNFEGPESGLSVSKKYFTFNNGRLYEHYALAGSDGNPKYNRFYNNYKESRITVILNDDPATVKDFKTINYEGSQSRKEYWLLGDASITDTSEFVQYPKDGWYAHSIKTDLASGTIKEFIKKEGKWYNYIRGADNIENSSEMGNLHVQGLGFPEGPPQLMPDVFNANSIE